ncbi:uncharacterized protein LOC123527979 [Mercenaria mercenaria]|uniref:uncharacterized protein LOC123527979 n=1 Tax=Mercenaria mercenaria TaxID=6596 RepID=UPI00234F8873|nr:uncharacterized protein LOC123527979 [Mercenaria mercenaria]
MAMTNNTEFPYHTLDEIAGIPTTVTDDTKKVASGFINLLVPPILITIGVTCNMMTILTMRTKYFRNVSTSVYLKAGAFNDVLALLISLSAHWLYVNFPEVYVRTDSSDLMCKFFNFYGSGNNDLGILIIAIMTAERAFVIGSPFGAVRVCSVKRAWKIMIGTIVFVILKECHFLISSDIVPAERTDRLCDVFPERRSDEYQVFYDDIWPWINLGYVLICGIAIMVSNCIILFYVRRSAGDKFKGGQTWRHLVPMLIGESVLVIVLTFPFSLHLALLAIRLKYDSTIYTDAEKAAAENLVFNMTFYMLYSNKCANFFMYCVTGSRFREGLSVALIDFFCNKKLKEKVKSRSSLVVSTITPKVFSNKETESRRRCNCSKSSCCESDDSDAPYDIIELAEKTQKSYSVYI